MITYLVKVLAEARLDTVSQELDEPDPVLVVRQPVVEDAHDFVAPQPHKLLGLGHGDGVCHADAHHHASKVSQVEEVMALGGGGQQRFERSLVDVHGCLYGVGRLPLDVGGHGIFLEDVLHDARKDAHHRLIVKLCDADHVEPSEESRRDEGAPAAWRAHGCHIHHVFNSEERLFFELKPPAVIHILAQNLDGRLRAIRLLGGHVEVVDKGDALFADRRSVHAFATLVEFGFDDVLRLLRRCLR